MRKIFALAVAFLLTASLVQAEIRYTPSRALLTQKVNNITVNGEIDWAAGNVIFVPTSKSLATAVAAASDGDTLILGDGTYSVGAGIAVNKKLNIVGQGAGETIISSSSAGAIGFSVTDTSRIANLSIVLSGGGEGGGIYTTAQLNVENVKITLTPNAEDDLYGIKCFDATIVVCNSSISVTNSGATYFASGILSEGTSTVYVYDTDIYTKMSNAAGTSYSTGLDCQSTAMYVDGCRVNATQGSGTITTYGASAAGLSCSMYLNNSVVAGADYDVNHSGTGVFLINGTSLVSGTTKGDISETGTFVSNLVSINTVSLNTIKWNTGNVRTVGINEDIASVINRANAGDTLILASGTYTITSQITINKQLHIKGQGAGATTITSSSDISMIAITTQGGTILSDMTISNTCGAKATSGGMIEPTVGFELYNIEFLNTAVGAAGAYYECIDISAGGATNINIENCTSSCTGAIGMHSFLRQNQANTTTLRNCYFNASGGTWSGYGSDVIYVSAGSLYIYNCNIGDSESILGGALHVNGGAHYVINTTLNGPGALAYDLKVDAGNIYLYGCDLLNGKSTGTGITIIGQLRVNDVSSNTVTGNTVFATLKVGATQADARATINELWVDSDDDWTVKQGR